ncbi:M23 family metallopeptidase [Streptomyces sp. SP18ES09]|uniref:M23 family metallopeptidase n=1 Tax=Streptomyces sp. SP18ES09 TaxID=3002532 RepID=UPI002E759EFC|nr:M23 family metallopeptidase [Streptomyces sp. SP18ES09]MEE1818872.1 M23 family metallopeptidase [Streptomyces sp. SP18ES09]
MASRKVAGVVHRALWLVFVVQAVASVLVEPPYPYAVGWLPAIAALVLGVTLSRTARRRFEAAPPREPVVVAAPVTGRWSALNSPADRTPSHGTHQLAQTYAIDIVREDVDRPRPGFARLWPVARRSEDFPAFGAPLLAVADGTVVRAEDGQRDHLGRGSLPGLAYLILIESSFRALGGARRITGNHLVLDLGDGTYAMYAHLRRGSLAVRPGDRVVAGRELARCGNSGNSTEPHVHFQLMDGPDPETALGLPFTWRGVGLPGNGETFEVPAPAHAGPAGGHPAAA